MISKESQVQSAVLEGKITTFAFSTVYWYNVRKGQRKIEAGRSALPAAADRGGSI